MAKTPEEIRARRHAYSMAHRAEKSLYDKTYRQVHHAKRTAQDNAYRAANSLTISARRKARYQQNRDKIFLQHQACYQRHKTKRLLYARAYYAAHKLTAAMQSKAYREAHKDEIAARGKAYRLTHQAQIAANKLAYSRAHPEKEYEHQATRRARKAQALHNDLTHAQWLEIQAVQNHRCYYCGKRYKGRLTQDHITPLIDGGSHTLHNVIGACQSCNSKKHTGPPLKPVQPLLLTIAPTKKPKTS
jgi:5-methylcytosine-specific restriction endonuclease McrA